MSEEQTPNEELTPQAPDLTPSEPGTVTPTATADAGGFYWGTGRRKAAVARVRIRPAAEGAQASVTINGKPYAEYFTELRDQHGVMFPLEVTQTQGKVDIFVNATGGGFMGQAGAVALGISRALMGYDPSLEPTLRENNLLSRDSRRVERKKYGQPGARKRFQFSKR